MAKEKTLDKPLTEKEVSLVVQETETIIQSLDPLPARIRKLNMKRDEDYEILMGEGRVTKEIQRQIEAKQKWVVAGLDIAKKRIRSLFQPMLIPCKEVLELIDQRQREYFQIQDRKREEEQKRLDKEAEEEQKRLDKNAKAKAKRLQDKGETHQAKAVLAEVPEVEAAKAQEIIAPKVEGVSKTKIWDYEIQDEHEVPESAQIANGEVMWLWDRCFHRAGLLAVRRDGQEIPGVRFFQKDSTRYGKLQ